LYAPHPEKPLTRRVLVTHGGLSSGFELPDASWTVITHGRAASARRSNKA
jgi:hypothetical protein